MIRENLLLLIRHDIIRGILNRWKAYVGALFLFVFLLFSGFHKIQLFYQTNGITGTFGMVEMFLYLFLGNAPFDPSAFSGIDLSMEWLSFFAYLLYITGFYPNEELQKEAGAFLVRVKSKTLWWTSKCIWCVFSVCTYFFLFLLVTGIFVLCFGDITSFGNLPLLPSYFEVSLGTVKPPEFFFNAFALPLVMAIAISELQMLLSLRIRPIFSFLCMICYAAAAAFYANPVLLYHYTMLGRSAVFLPSGTISAQTGLWLAAVMLAVTYFVGVLCMKRKDII